MRFYVSDACSHSQRHVRKSTRVLLLSLAAVVASAAPAVAQSNCQMRGGQCSAADQAAAAAAVQAQCVACEGNPCANEPVCNEPACRRWDFGNQCGPAWIIRADELVLQRGNTRDQVLFADTPTGTTDLLNSKDDLNFPVALGFQISAMREVRPDLWFEVGYFQLDGWEANNGVSGSSRMILDRTGAFDVVTDASARYTSAIYLGEMNLRKQATDWLTVLAGLRFGEMNERYRGGDATYTLANNAFNHLYGGQVGADVEVYNDGQWRLNGLCKAGLYTNFAEQYSSNNATTIADSRQSSSFMGETGAVLTYQVNEHLAFRAIGQAMWLQGVAMAPEQARANDFGGGVANVNMTGSLFYYGAGVGCEVTF